MGTEDADVGEATSVFAWFTFYTRLYEDEYHVARPSHTLLQLLHAAYVAGTGPCARMTVGTNGVYGRFPQLYDEIVARRFSLGAQEWECVVALLEGFYEVWWWRFRSLPAFSWW
jgi:hypothetical protein